MEQAITATLPPHDLAALDRVCRDQGVSRDDAVENAVRWYIDREGDLPPIEYNNISYLTGTANHHLDRSFVSVRSVSTIRR
jgi:metal-responsive CopG/Arc/MetJ family transcriptional regulator